MPSGKTLAARPQPGLLYNGVNLASPAPVQMKPMTNFTIGGAINQAQEGQNQANLANNTRYNQGLGVLTGGANQSAGAIQNALKNSAYLGNKQLQDINRQETAGHASTQQSAMNRGIGNTTILDSLQGGVTTRANNDRLAVRDMVQKNNASLNLAQAQNFSNSAGSIANFIGARNDNAPSLGEYAGLVQGAASAVPQQQRTGTVTKGSINDPGFGHTGSDIQVPSSSGGAIGSGQYITGSGGAVGGGMGDFQFGSGGFGGGGGGGGGGSGSYVSGSGGTGSVAQALGTGGTGNYSPVMANAGYAQGSVSVTPSAGSSAAYDLDGPNPTVPTTVQSNSVKAPCRKYNYIFDSGQDPNGPQFCK